MCVFFPSILDIKFVGRTSRGHTGGRSHRIVCSTDVLLFLENCNGKRNKLGHVGGHSPEMVGINLGSLMKLDSFTSGAESVSALLPSKKEDEGRVRE